MNTQSQTQRPTRLIQVSESPSIWLMFNFLSDEQCDHLIHIAHDKLRPAVVVSTDSTEMVRHEARTNSLTFFPLGYDAVVSEVENKISAIIQTPVNHGEGMQVLNYKLGQEYKPHFDFFNPDEVGGAKAIGKAGQRFCTVLLYLSDVEEGGETEFPEIGLKVEPEKGLGLLFYNLYADGSPDRNTLHSSVPVIRGEKWVATKWVRQQPYL